MNPSSLVARTASPHSGGTLVERNRKKSILTLFGTRPEVIKLAPVLRELERQGSEFRTINVASGQHADLVYPFVEMFGIRVDFDLCLMTPDQNPQGLLHCIVRGASDIVDREQPDLILVQGDTTTALAGAIAGHRRGVRVAHIEAGLRSGNVLSPYPEEINRVSIAQLATLHFAATETNRLSLMREGISDRSICVTGNPIVDALHMLAESDDPSGQENLYAKIAGRRCIVLTTHRRESFGRLLEENLGVLRDFLERHVDLVLVFPVHPNPHVSTPARKILGNCPRAFLIPPLPYREFIQLVRRSWLIVSDSGGIQEEVPTLGKALLILRDTTERPECIDAGMARLVGGDPEMLRVMLEEAYKPNSWADSVHQVANPFGKGDSAARIVAHLTSLLEGKPISYSAMGK